MPKKKTGNAGRGDLLKTKRSNAAKRAMAKKKRKPPIRFSGRTTIV